MHKNPPILVPIIIVSPVTVPYESMQNLTLYLGFVDKLIELVDKIRCLVDNLMNFVDKIHGLVDKLPHFVDKIMILLDKHSIGKESNW